MAMKDRRIKVAFTQDNIDWIREQLVEGLSFSQFINDLVIEEQLRQAQRGPGDYIEHKHENTE